MYEDLFGKKRMKINLHMHTSLSDGEKTIEQAALIYKNAGYDAVAITDHWVLNEKREIEGLRVIPAVEYNTNSNNGEKGVYHILGINCKKTPCLDINDSAQKIVDEIKRCEGLAVLAHPAWSINTPEGAAHIEGIDITEIYNSVSDAHQSSRPYSGCFVDASACMGKFYNLIATDDTHYYDGTDETCSYIMVECDEDATDDEIINAIKDGRFYATQGPELIVKKEGSKIKIHTSPVSRISLFSNIVWSDGYCVKGEGLTYHEYEIKDETFIRVEATDKDGKFAWSNIICL